MGEIYGNVMGEEVRSYGIYKSYCATYDLYTGKKKYNLVTCFSKEKIIVQNYMS